MLLVATLAAGRTTVAHEAQTGQPKLDCEGPDDTWIHEYETGTGFMLIGPRSSATAPRIQATFVPPADGSIPPCPYGDTTWDGHHEFAYGGAWLQAAHSVCAESYPDHFPGTLVWVYDSFLGGLGSDVAFSVYADWLDNDPLQSEPTCGDFESDYGMDCINICAPGFPPGLDGSYQVYVSGTTGHVYTGYLRECYDRLDNDNDGLTDYPLDPGCEAPEDDTESPDPLWECSDTRDNDQDGLADYPRDPDCEDPFDNRERGPQCRDGIDNDGDGRVDFPTDLGCETSEDDSESPDPPQCSDRTDNDGDGLLDYPEDPGCTSGMDNSESPDPQCNDRTDNDGDGMTDFPADPGCTSSADNSESPNPACSDGLDNDGDGLTDHPADPDCTTKYHESEGVDCRDTVIAPAEGSTHRGGATVYFRVGAGRTLTGENVWHSGGPPPNPNPITHSAHTGTGGGSEHKWTVGASSDFETRQFTYSFTTDGACGGVRTHTGTFKVYN